MNDIVSILIVDDEISIINSLMRVFRNMNYNLLTTTIPENAMNIIDKSKLDIIICDYNMPNINGVEILRYSKKVLPDATRILMTGYSDVNIAVSAINEGSVFYYISKPWNNEEVITIVNNAIDKKRSQVLKNDLYCYINDSQNYLTEIANKLKSIEVMDEQKNLKISVIEDENIILINQEDVLYLIAEKGDVYLVTSNGKYKSHDSLTEWNKKLGDNKFFQCHRSYLINLEKIEKLSPWFNGAYNINLKNVKDSIPVSRNKMKVLRYLLNL